MKRDIQDMLERWGAWAANDHSNVDWQPIAAGFKGLLPYTTKSRPQCTDDEGIMIDGCVAQLKKHREEEYELIIHHYVFNQSKRAIARRRKKDEKIIRISLQLAEAFVEGCLRSIGINC